MKIGTIAALTVLHEIHRNNMMSLEKRTREMLNKKHNDQKKKTVE